MKLQYIQYQPDCDQEVRKLVTIISRNLQVTFKLAYNAYALNNFRTLRKLC